MQLIIEDEILFEVTFHLHTPFWSTTNMCKATITGSFYLHPAQDVYTLSVEMILHC